MSKVWTSEELARECKNCEVASAGRIRSQAETISQLRETIALMSRERSKMREALLRCDAIAQMPEIREYTIVKEMRNLIKKALSAPPRNCDVGTDEEQAKRHKRFCDGKGMKYCWGRGCFKCFAAWEQMQYEKEAK